MSTSTEMTLGELLKKRRELMQLTLRDVEESAGVSNAYLSQLENNKIKNPSASVLCKLAKMYNMSVDDLLIASGLTKRNELLVFPKEWRSFNGISISMEEEEQLLTYLSFLRYQKQKKRH